MLYYLMLPFIFSKLNKSGEVIEVVTLQRADMLLKRLNFEEMAI